MKKVLLTTAVIFLALFYASETKAEYRNSGGYGYFYTSLAPHGSWIELDHGVVVWRPAIIRRGWAPYMHGQWLWTSDGWYWDSYEPFGHITYHYGRWYLDDYYGWIWVPDYEWAPAWVEWRYDNNYIGWAPLPPYAVFSVNIGLHFSIDYHTPYHHWHFVKYRYFCDPYVNKYYVAPKYRHGIHSKTKYRTNYAYEGGRVVNRSVDVNYIRERTGQNIRTRELERVSDPREVGSSSTRKNSEKVRTFSAPREEMMKDRGNVEVKRAERKSSLQTSKVELSSRSARETERTPAVRNDNNTRNDVRSSTNENSRTNTDRNTAPRIREEQPAVENRGAEKRTPQSNVEQRNSQPAERKAEPGVVRKTETQKPAAPKVEKRTETQKPAAPRVEKRTETQKPAATQERERKVEPRQEKRESPARVERQGSSEKRTESSGRERRQR
ncbi:MAG: DUF6600 domain-containing protein [Ignavibacteriaceae bacterium]